jgi:hypothetical protein
MVNGPFGQKNPGKTTRRLSLRTALVIVLLIAATILTLRLISTSPSTGDESSSLVGSPVSYVFSPFWDDQDFTSAAPELSSHEPVYSYSVIPGGTASAQDLQAALRRDPIAAAHYSGFHAESAHLIRLKNERRVHVSYRIGDQIYWTRKEVTLRAGEALLSDGAHLARTRCGNRVAEVPDGPTSPAEPPIDAINNPVFPHPPEITTDVVPAGPIWSDESTPVLLAFGGNPRPISPSSVPFMIFPPIGPCCGTSGSKPSSPQPTPQPSPQPSPQPQPSPSPAPSPTPTPTPTPTPAPTPTPSPSPSPNPAPTPTPPVSPVPPPPSTPPTPLPEPPPVPPPIPPTPAPEPSSMIHLIIGLAGIAFFLKFRRP